MNPIIKTDDTGKFQRNSWEIEILISGGACFALYQLSTSLNAFASKLDSSTIFSGGIILMLSIGVLRILSIYFAIHLSIRAFWLSLVLLEKIFSQGINKEKLNYHEPYNSKATEFNFTQRISYTDKLSGLIFAWAITFTLIFFGLSLAFSLCAAIAYSAPRISSVLTKNIWWRITLAIFMNSFIVFLIDLFFYGIIRRTKFLAKLFYPIYFFWDKISLGFLWRPSLQIIFTNVKSRWKTSFLVLLGTVIIVYITDDEDGFLKTFKTRKHPTERIVSDENWYLNKRKERINFDQEDSYIQSDVIQDNFLKVYVDYSEFDDRNVDSLKTKEKYFSKLVVLSIDDSVLVSPAWIGVNGANEQKGIQTVIDITHLRKELHTLKISRTYNKTPLNIPFWKQ